MIMIYDIYVYIENEIWVFKLTVYIFFKLKGGGTKQHSNRVRMRYCILFCMHTV